MKNLLTFLFLVFGTISISAQTAMTTTSVDIRTQIDQYIQGYIDNGKLPGGVFMVMKDGESLYSNALGNNGDVPYKMDDIFRMASMTKAVTCVAIMQLVEQGKVDLDDPLSKYFPAFSKTGVLDSFNAADSSYTTVPQASPITIKNLLTHTSGIYYPLFSPGKLQAIGTKNGTAIYGLAGLNTTEEMANHLASQPLAHQPGAQWTYGLNMEVLGAVIAKVSGKTLQQYFRDHILDPLGMADTWFYLPFDKHARLVKLYRPSLTGGIEINTDPLMMYPMMPDHDHYAGGGGLSGTAGDYTRFIQALLNDGSLDGVQILQPSSVTALRTDVMDEMSIPLDKRGWMGLFKQGFGLGFSVTNEHSVGPYSPGTYAWSGYFNTKFWIDPVQNITFVGMTNIVPFQDNQFWDGLYAMIYENVK